MSSHAPKIDTGSKLVFVISLVFILLTVYVLVSMLINTYKENSTKGEIDTTSHIASTSNNLKPIGFAATSDTVAVAAPTAARSGKEVYTAVCAACHSTGVAGAPKTGDKASWETRVATGMDAMMTVAIDGKGAMPARGGQNVGDEELQAAIIYMTKESGFDLAGTTPAPVTTPVAEQASETPTETTVKAAPSGVTHEIKMLNSGADGTMVFEPASLNVAVGDTVKFISTDAGHNTVSEFIPEGATGWNGAIGEEVSITFDKEGVYIYSCAPHKILGMVGVIQVGAASNKDAALAAAKEMSSTFVMGKDRLDKYMGELAEGGSTSSSASSSTNDATVNKMSEEKPNTAPANNMTHEIKMLNSGADGTMVFEPASLNVAVGDTVKFISTDAGHNTVSEFTPEGATTWNGAIGEEVSITIDKEGVYIYSCTPHRMLGMVGVIQAGTASNKDAALVAAKKMSSMFVMGKDRLDKYIGDLKE